MAADESTKREVLKKKKKKNERALIIDYIGASFFELSHLFWLPWRCTGCIKSHEADGEMRVKGRQVWKNK